jgi:hypothetical protein
VAKRLLFPEDLERLVRRRYQLHHGDWLAGEGTWPLSLGLGKPLERDMGVDALHVRRWVDAWRNFGAPLLVHWEEVRWPRLGAQRLPVLVEASEPLQVARWMGDDERYLRAMQRHAQSSAEWPMLGSSKLLARAFDVLADYADGDWRRLTSLLRWLLDNPRSGHTLRAIPLEGLDTKWLDGPRRALVSTWLRALRSHAVHEDFYAVTGLSPLPSRARLRILCPTLRASVGGLTDLEAPLAELAQLPIAPAHCLIVENLESGIALPDFDGCIAFVGMGNAVVSLAEIPWLRGIDTLYWGDLDTHGFAILHRTRAALGNVRSVSMDASTLLQFRALWGKEAIQNVEIGLGNLTEPEREVLEGLRGQRWGPNVRLEQERIPWSVALRAVRAALGEPQHPE